MNKQVPRPKVFISYSWTTPQHCELIRDYAERLCGDGVDVILDQWELSEGQDKYVFMEKMVTDSTVTHVLIFSDKQYAEKANARKAGVGTESQIMSKEIYEKVDQKKFIPMVCEFDEHGQPYLPTFLHPRIWIDFSTPENAHKNWEKLLRALHGKPLHVKPAIGKVPSYIIESETVSIPTKGKFAVFKQAILDGRPGASHYRQDFLDAVFAFADSLRVRQKPDVTYLDEKTYSDMHPLQALRDQFLDWLMLELSVSTGPDLEELVLANLERILALKFRPEEVTQWSDGWFESMAIFVHEMFLYSVAALIKNCRFALINSVFRDHYALPEFEQQRRGKSFVTFGEFRTHARSLAERNERLKLNRIDLMADLFKDRATRTDLSFNALMEADLFAFVAAASSGQERWYPSTLIYAGYGKQFPQFVRATQKRYFERLAPAFNVTTGDELRKLVKEGYERMKVNTWTNFSVHSDVSFWYAANIEALDTIE